LSSLCPETKILVFTMHDEHLHAQQVLRAGAHRYLTKEQGGEHAILAIRELLRGNN
jgi:DNA-binding NarL/FixJ family response regulator